MSKGAIIKFAVASFFIIAAATSFAKAPPEIDPFAHTSTEAGKPYTRDVTQPPTKTPLTVPTDAPVPGRLFNLTDLVDIALKNNPSTSHAWYVAQEQAAAWGIARGAYYPKLDGSLKGNAGKIPTTLGSKSFFTAGAALNYLLFDFGGRSATIQSAKQALIAANLNHNQAIQDLLRDVPQAYYILTGRKALVVSYEQNLKEARVSLNAAEQRKLAGVATVADVLEAKANEQQIVYDLAKAKGDVEVARGKLAVLVGWPVNASFEIETIPAVTPIKGMSDDVNKMISDAQKNRADLNASVALAHKQEAEIKKARAAMLPTFNGTGNLQYTKQRYWDETGYYGGLQIAIPIFEAFTLKNRLRQTEAQLKAAISDIESKKLKIMDEVWSAYYNFDTSRVQLSAAIALLASASESYDVSLARYKAGAADIVELMTTQTQLAKARSQLDTTRMAYFVNYAELIHSVGEEYTSANVGEEFQKILKEVD
jgi:outer membrane protein TolC